MGPGQRQDQAEAGKGQGCAARARSIVTCLSEIGVPDVVGAALTQRQFDPRVPCIFDRMHIPSSVISTGRSKQGSGEYGVWHFLTTSSGGAESVCPTLCVQGSSVDDGGVADVLRVWLAAFGLLCLIVLFVWYDSADAAFGVLDVALVSGYEVAMAVKDALPCDGAAI